MIWVVLKSRTESPLREKQRKGAEHVYCCPLWRMRKLRPRERKWHARGHQLGREIRESQVLCWAVPMCPSPFGSFTRVYLQITQTFFRVYFSQDLSWNSDSGGQGCIERTAQVILKANPLETQLLDPLWFVCFTPRCLLRAGVICF